MESEDENTNLLKKNHAIILPYNAAQRLTSFLAALHETNLSQSNEMR